MNRASSILKSAALLAGAFLLGCLVALGLGAYDAHSERITPLTGDDIADVAFYAASAPKHVQIAEVLVLATHQANGTVIHRENL